MRPVRRPAVTAVGVAVLVALGVAGCTGGSSPRAAAGTATGPGTTVGAVAAGGTVPAASVAVRWWSNSKAAAGSTISATDPLAVARSLHPSRTDYCGMLRETLAAGHAVLPGVTAGDPALLTATTAFTGELQHAAPGTLGAAWATLGHAAVALVGAAQGGAAPTGVDAAAVQRAAATVAADAKQACGVDLSKRSG